MAHRSLPKSTRPAVQKPRERKPISAEAKEFLYRQQPTAVAQTVARKQLEGQPWQAAPSRQVLDERLEAQRRRIFQAQGICALAREAAADLSESCDTGQDVAEGIRLGMELVCDLLESAAGELDPSRMLRREEVAP